MFEERILHPNQLPIPEKSRQSTDIICTVIGAVFALFMFIIACVFWNKGAFENHFFNFNQAGNGQSCGDQFVYTPNPLDHQARTCVSACPQFYYPAKGLCLPENHQLRSEYLENEEITAPFDFVPFKWTLFYTAILSLATGFIWLGMVHCCPKYAPFIAQVGAIVFLITLGVLFLVLSDRFFNLYQWAKIVVAIICFLLAIMVLVIMCLYKNQRKFQAIFLDYARTFLNENPTVFAYIPIYLILTLGLVALIVWQHCCYTSKYAVSKNFFNFNNVGILEVLNVLEFIWGLQFLKDSFNFNVSGVATDWYWLNGKSDCYKPYRRLVCFHWGSVVGGSFFNAFFELPSLIIELLICHPEACCTELGHCCQNSCEFCDFLFDMIRTDTYSYINMLGYPFCNSAKTCKQLCKGSQYFIGHHSPMKHYRFLAHLFTVTAVLLMSWFIMRARLINYGFWNFFLIILVIESVLSWFINIHADAAEALQTSYLTENVLDKEDGYMYRVLEKYKIELDHLQKAVKKDGNC